MVNTLFQEWTMKQNPHACSDGACVLLVPGAPKGQITNGGCRCLPNHMDPDTRVRVRKGIYWLAKRLATMEPLVEEATDIVSTISHGHDVFLDAVDEALWGEEGK